MERLIVFYNYSACHRIDSFDILTDFPEFILKRNDYEVDIGTTGTDCDPRYPSRIYNDGDYITRGAARIVYSSYYADTRMPVDPEDRYVFYTYNPYNDFQEYLNYENGWGTMFGNITGGGVISSKNPSECNPTPYVPTIRTYLP